MRGLLSRPLLRRRGHFLVQWHEFDRWRVIYCTHLISRSRWWRPGEVVFGRTQWAERGISVGGSMPDLLRRNAQIFCCQLR